MKKILLMAGMFAAASSSADMLDSSLKIVSDLLVSDHQYVSAHVTTSDYDAQGISDNASGFSVLAGYHLKDTPFTLEAGFANLGESEIKQVQSEDLKISSRTFFADAKYSLQLVDQLSAYAKVGLHRISVKQATATESDTDAQTKMLYVVGAQYNLGKVAFISSEFVAYSADITSLSLGMAYKF